MPTLQGRVVPDGHPEPLDLHILPSSDIGDGRYDLQDSRKPLTLWFRAIWWVTTQKNGASALGMQRVLGLGQYRTAWTWLHRLRCAMVRPGRERLSGWVEVDAVYVGGSEKAAPGRSLGKKALVAVAAEADGWLERGGFG